MITYYLYRNACIHQASLPVFASQVASLTTISIYYLFNYYNKDIRYYYVLMERKNLDILKLLDHNSY